MGVSLGFFKKEDDLKIWMIDLYQIFTSIFLTEEQSEKMINYKIVQSNVRRFQNVLQKLAITSLDRTGFVLCLSSGLL